MAGQVSTERANQIIGVARILAATDPVAWGRLLAEHIADASGHCAQHGDDGSGSFRAGNKRAAS